MVRTIHQIERDLAALDEAAIALSIDFQAAYRDYLTALGETVRRQLVLATYQLCTQGYPEKFLRLAVQQRQTLQEDLKALTRSAQQELLELLEIPADLQAEPQEFAGERQEREVQEREVMDFGSATSLIEDEVESLSTPDGELLFADHSTTPLADALPADNPPSHLENLLDWREDIETGILEVLQTLSQKTNHLLHRVNILPNKLPEQVLDAATKSDLSAEVTGSSPNLLNLMVEAKSKKEDEAEVTRIVAIRLRLSEIEFGDVTLTTWRSKLRGLASRLNQLERDFQKRQREMAIARAEAAWRSTWFDDV